MISALLELMDTYMTFELGNSSETFIGFSFTAIAMLKNLKNHTLIIAKT